MSVWLVGGWGMCLILLSGGQGLGGLVHHCGDLQQLSCCQFVSSIKPFCVQLYSQSLVLEYVWKLSKIQKGQPIIITEHIYIYNSTVQQLKHSVMQQKDISSQRIRQLCWWRWPAVAQCQCWKVVSHECHQCTMTTMLTPHLWAGSWVLWSFQGKPAEGSPETAGAPLSLKNGICEYHWCTSNRNPSEWFWTPIHELNLTFSPQR